MRLLKEQRSFLVLGPVTMLTAFVLVLGSLATKSSVNAGPERDGLWLTAHASLLAVTSERAVSEREGFQVDQDRISEILATPTPSPTPRPRPQPRAVSAAPGRVAAPAEGGTVHCYGKRYASLGANHGGNVALGRELAASRGWTGGQWGALLALWTCESQWNHTLRNPSSGAYGIPQALPGSKMSSHGSDWQTNPRTQILWGLDYVASRYTNPVNAWAHFQRRNWY